MIWGLDSHRQVVAFCYLDNCIGLSLCQVILCPEGLFEHRRAFNVMHYLRYLRFVMHSIFQQYLIMIKVSKRCYHTYDASVLTCWTS